VKFSSAEEFELKVHKCFQRIFELLMKTDAVIKEKAEQEEAEGNIGVMNDARDWVEEMMLQCHLAWQYHRLSKGPGRSNTWERIENPGDEDESPE